MNALREQIYEITKKVMYGDRSPRHATDDIMLLIESKLQPLTPKAIREEAFKRHAFDFLKGIGTNDHDTFIEGAIFASTPRFKEIEWKEEDAFYKGECIGGYDEVLTIEDKVMYYLNIPSLTIGIKSYKGKVSLYETIEQAKSAVEASWNEFLTKITN